MLEPIARYSDGSGMAIDSEGHAEEKRKPLDEGGAAALREEVLQDSEARAAYEATREQLDFLAQARELRKSLKLSQEKVAALMGTAQSAVSDLEAGRVTPQLHTLQRYAQALGAHLELHLAESSTNGGSRDSDVVRQLMAPRIVGSLLMNLWTDSRTIAAMANATTWPEGVLEPILARLQSSGWATSTLTENQTAYALNKAAGRIIGLYLRRDRVTGVLQNLDAEVSDTRTDTPLDGSRESIVSLAAALVQDLLSIPLPGQLIGVGVTVAGTVNTETGTVVFAPDLQNPQDSWREVPLQQLLGDELRRLGHDLPVAVENDANALAVREYLRRLGRYIAAIVLSGGGIGVGAVMQSRGLAEVYHGAHFRAGEGGHTTIDPSGPPCRVGFPHRGCLETVASAEGVLARIGITATGDEEIQRGLLEANRRMREGDKEPEIAFSEAGLYFGRFIAAAQAFLDPDMIVVTAHQQLVSVSSECGETFRAGVSEALRQSALGPELGPVEFPRLEWEALDRETFAVGAGSAAWRYFLAHPEDVSSSIIRTVGATEGGLNLLALTGA
jgi:predicted NBD/HSP70 family sugar kinase/transcriptional regulator with XRE-family HTH domain